MMLYTNIFDSNISLQVEHLELFQYEDVVLPVQESTWYI